MNFKLNTLNEAFLLKWFYDIFRQLCVLLNAEDIYKALSKILLKEKNLKFVATMVDVLNTILLTSAELYDLRVQLKNFDKPVSVIEYPNKDYKYYRTHCLPLWHTSSKNTTIIVRTLRE